MNPRRFTPPALVVLGMLLLNQQCHAGPATQGLEVAAGFRYGISSGDRWNPFGPGVGLEAGYTFDGGVHLGGVAEYFFGVERETSNFRQRSTNLQVLGLAGYDIGLSDHFVLRPELVAGIAKLNDETCELGASCTNSRYSAAVLAAGARLFFVVPHPTISLDVRYELLAADFVGTGIISSLGVGF